MYKCQKEFATGLVCLSLLIEYRARITVQSHKYPGKHQPGILATHERRYLRGAQTGSGIPPPILPRSSERSLLRAKSTSKRLRANAAQFMYTFLRGFLRKNAFSSVTMAGRRDLLNANTATQRLLKSTPTGRLKRPSPHQSLPHLLHPTYPPQYLSHCDGCAT